MSIVGPYVSNKSPIRWLLSLYCRKLVPCANSSSVTSHLIGDEHSCWKCHNMYIISHERIYLCTLGSMSRAPCQSEADDFFQSFPSARKYTAYVGAGLRHASKSLLPYLTAVLVPGIGPWTARNLPSSRGAFSRLSMTSEIQHQDGIRHGRATSDLRLSLATTVYEALVRNFDIALLVALKTPQRLSLLNLHKGGLRKCLGSSCN